MSKAKRGGRALRHKNKSDTPDLSETEGETAPEQPAPKAKANAAVHHDFKIQAKIHIEKLEEAYTQQAQAIKLQYRKMLLTIDPDVLELTLGQFRKLQDAYRKDQDGNATLETEEVDAQPVKTTQSPNVTSSRATRSSSQKSEANNASIYTTPEKESSPSGEDEPKDQETEVTTEKEQPPQTQKTKHSELVPYQPRASLVEPVAKAAAVVDDFPASMFTGMPLLNLFIPVKNGTAVTVLGRPVENVANLPEISPSVMRGLEVMQMNIEKLTKAWRAQQQRRTSNRKSIKAGPSRK